MNLRTQKAYDFFYSENYEESLEIFESLNNDIGNDCFSYNIIKCREKILDNNKTFNIAYISDSNFLMPTYVSIYSLKKNRSTKYTYKVYLILNNVSIDQANNFESLSSEGFSVVIKHVNEKRDYLSINKNGFHVSTSALLKFDLPNIFNELDEILYIDGDTIINKDLTDIFSTGLNGLYAAVVEDIKPKIIYKPSILDKLKISNHRGYFNSGVLFLNLKKMREDNIQKKLFEYRVNELNYFMDQDAFNVVFKDQVKLLSCKKNCLVTLEDSFNIDQTKKLYPDINAINGYRDLICNSDIIHFASKNKPWIRNGVKHSDIWYSYYIESNAFLKDFSINHNVSEYIQRKLIVSLTSWPGRIETVYEVIDKIKDQSFKPEKIILWLADEQFQNKEKDLPNSLLSRISNDFEIRWCSDIRSYKKLIPSLTEYKNHIIVTADDDILYKKDWLKGLVVSYLQEPEVIHCYRAHQIIFDENFRVKPYKLWKRDIKNSDSSYLNFFTGCGGVLYPPRSLYHHVNRRDLFESICPTGDDIWFWAMAVLNGTRIKLVSHGKFDLEYVPATQDNGLWHINDNGGGNDVMLRKVFERYPEIIMSMKKCS